MHDKTQKIGLCVMLEENKSNYHIISYNFGFMSTLTFIVVISTSGKWRCSMIIKVGELKYIFYF